MTSHATIRIVNLPGALYDRLKQRAEQSHRSVEDELLETVAEALPVAEPLPAELAGASVRLAQADDASLWQLVCNPMPRAQTEALEELHLKRQDQGLSEAESQTAAELTRQYEHALFLRAQAIALLIRRENDVSTILFSL